MKIRGFTLLEMLLVLVIITSVMAMFVGYTLKKSEETRIDNMVMTTQQILSAGLAYYNDHGEWTPCTDGNGCYFMKGDGLPLLEDNYLPNQDYYTLWPGGTDKNDTFLQFGLRTEKKFTVCIPIAAGANARVIAETIASRLPLGQTTQAPNNDGSDETRCGEAMEIIPCEDETLPCRVVTSVNIPGQNLNNARSLNFGGVYRNGACVPVPECPGKDMVPQILVSPAAVAGLSEGMNGASSTSGDVVPISSFTAYATTPTKWVQGSEAPPSCEDQTQTSDCLETTGGDPLPQNQKYWRVCLAIVTEKGKLTGSKWVKESGSVAVITRCAPPGEPHGSNFDLFEAK
jgi:prepilin-type N-terminal cleavage/methylation domain-containing protein